MGEYGNGKRFFGGGSVRVLFFPGNTLIVKNSQENFIPVRLDDLIAI